MSHGGQEKKLRDVRKATIIFIKKKKKKNIPRGG
jgi:hypothetical protein